MMLFDEYMTACVRLEKQPTPDGLGGFRYEWADGASFSAAVVKDTSVQIRPAEKAGLAEQYTVTVYKGTQLGFHDVFRRVSDGAVFRVTSNVTDSETPARASFGIGQVTAERWEIPA